MFKAMTGYYCDTYINRAYINTSGSSTKNYGMLAKINKYLTAISGYDAINKGIHFHTCSEMSSSNYICMDWQSATEDYPELEGDWGKSASANASVVRPYLAF